MNINIRIESGLYKSNNHVTRDEIMQARNDARRAEIGDVVSRTKDTYPTLGKLANSYIHNYKGLVGNALSEVSDVLEDIKTFPSTHSNFVTYLNDNGITMNDIDIINEA